MTNDMEDLVQIDDDGNVVPFLRKKGGSHTDAPPNGLALRNEVCPCRCHGDSENLYCDCARKPCRNGPPRRDGVAELAIEIHDTLFGQAPVSVATQAERKENLDIITKKLGTFFDTLPQPAVDVGALGADTRLATYLADGLVEDSWVSERLLEPGSGGPRHVRQVLMASLANAMHTYRQAQSADAAPKS